MSGPLQVPSRFHPEGFGGTDCADAKCGPNLYPDRSQSPRAVELDRTDVEILRALQGDARLSFRDLAHRIGQGHLCQRLGYPTMSFLGRSLAGRRLSTVQLRVARPHLRE